ncbi:hypothetical protein ACNKHO_17725 [Shigella flexneri]
MLIAMTISSILLRSTSRFFTPGYSGVFYWQSGKQTLEDEVWQSSSRSGNSFREQDTVQGIAKGRDTHRAGKDDVYCANGMQTATASGIAPASEIDQNGIPALVTGARNAAGATSCEGKGVE